MTSSSQLKVQERHCDVPSRFRRRKRRRPRSATGMSMMLSALALCVSRNHEFTVEAYIQHQAFSRRPSRPVSSSANRQPSSSSLDMASNLATDGLSPYFQGILSRTNSRQRFVTGKYPLIIDVEENPTAKWLNLGRMDENRATTFLLVNETTIERSLASYDRFQWIDAEDRVELHNLYSTVSLELLAEVNIPKPGYLNILPAAGPGASANEVRTLQSTTRWNRWRNSALYQELEEIQWNAPYRDRLWVTGFTLTGRKGLLQSVDAESGHIDSVNSRSEAMTLWPNEVNHVPKTLIDRDGSGEKFEIDDALLVSDGFLVPGKDRGGIYVVQNPSNPNSEWTTCLTDLKGDNWFYHRAVWVDLTGDGRKSILTARAKLRKGKRNNQKSSAVEEDSRPKNGQLVWLEMPEPHHFDKSTGTPLEEDGTTFDPFSTRHLPWKERVLATGPDVMFNVVDMDADDDTIEVIASQFFDKRVTLHSIKIGNKPYISFSRNIDDRCGAAFGGIVANLDGRRADGSTNVVIDSGSTVPTLQPGDAFSHVLVTSHECDYAESEEKELIESMTSHHPTEPHNFERSESLDGGSLFAYRVPEGKDAWKTESWLRTTVATGFKVKAQLWNVINPGAPGFVYTFHAKKDDVGTGKRPMIAIAGDCAESAYIFRPEDDSERKSPFVVSDPNAQYRLMSEIRCGATVGSIAIGYDDLCSAAQESGYAKIYIPCYEKDRILVFAMGSGEEDDGW